MSQPKQLPHERETWNGYSLDEIRYMRAYTAARIEINRDRLKRGFSSVNHLGPKNATGILGKVLGTLSFIDIALVTFRVASKTFKAFRWIKRR